MGEKEGCVFGDGLLVGQTCAPLRQSPFTERVLDLALPVLAAVVTAHDAQVVHRDLKPENIFLNEHHGHGVQPIVLDFGISKVLDDMTAEKLTATSTMVGTPLYMSPEQVRRSREVDPRTDQYALGVLLYEGLTGVSAFTGDSLYDLLLKKVEGTFVPLRSLRPELPEEMCSAIERAMAADRDHRHTNVRALATALMPFARERTRALWIPILSVQTGESEMTAEAVAAASAARADSTLRSSVRDLPAIPKDSPRPARAWRLPAAVALLALVIAIAFVVTRREPTVTERGAATAQPTGAIADTAAARPATPHSSPCTPRPSAHREHLADGEAVGIGKLSATREADGAHARDQREGFEPRQSLHGRSPTESVVRFARSPGRRAACQGESPAANAGEPRREGGRASRLGRQLHPTPERRACAARETAPHRRQQRRAASVLTRAHSSSSKPRFCSPSSVSIAANKRERSISHGPKSRFTLSTNTRSSFSR